MLVTTLNARLLENYGRNTVASWRQFTKRRIAVVVSPDEMPTFEEALGPDYLVLPFSARSLDHVNRIGAHERALDHRRDDFRWQAHRFSWKVFAIAEVLQAHQQQDQVIWLDADSLLKPGFDGWLQQVFSAEHGVSFLGRSHKRMHAETGLMNFKGEPGRRVFQRVLDIYESLDLFEYNEWHDAYVFTSVFQFNKHCFDICRSRGVKSSHPLHEMDRGRHIVHLKGMRKSASSSLRDDLRVLLRR